MQLDHVFVFVPRFGAEARRRLGALGLTESYTRAHPGQGTANVCYAFDNAFLELLWLEDASEAASPSIARTGLLERANRQAGSCPFGIAWRGEGPLPTWDYTPPYLPEGMSIPVATISDDPAQPMVFRSPGRAPPLEWPAERQAGLQHRSGRRDVSLTLGVPGEPHAQLEALAGAGLLELIPAETWGATLHLHGRDPVSLDLAALASL